VQELKCLPMKARNSWKFSSFVGTSSNRSTYNDHLKVDGLAKKIKFKQLKKVFKNMISEKDH
jgi:hypothetical protein